MNSRVPKNALIIFDPAFKRAAEGFVKENLQYREYHDNFFMLPVPLGDLKEEFSFKNLETLLKENGLSKEVIKDSDSYLIVKKEALCEEGTEIQQKSYNADVLRLAKRFKKYNVIFTYDYYLGHDKFNGTKKFRNIRQHLKFTSSQGFSSTISTQIGLIGAAESVNKSFLEKGIVGENFFGIKRSYHNPPFKYLLIDGMNALFKHLPVLDEKAKKSYQEAIEKEIALRQQSIEPILRKVEQDYRNPESVAEKLANLFDAYANSKNLDGRYPCQDLAKEIAKELYVYAANPSFEDDPWGVKCLFIIKEKVDSLSRPLDVRDSFQGLRLEILNMMQDGSLLQVGMVLKEHWQEKYKELEEIKDGLMGEEKKCVENILEEVRWLERSRKPYATLLRAVESTINIINNPSEANLHKHYQIAEEFWHKPWARVLSGAMLCLLGICIGIAIALTLYFTGGAALLAAPLLAKFAMLSASFVTAGAAIVAGSLPGVLPFAMGGILLFKPPLHAYLEKLGVAQEKAKTQATEIKLEML